MNRSCNIFYSYNCFVVHIYQTYLLLILSAHWKLGSNFVVVAAMKLHISLFRHLEKLIEALGGCAPELFLKDSTSGKMKFVLSLDVTKIPCSHVSVLPDRPHFFSGDDPHNSSCAEHKALMSVKKFLEDNFQSKFMTLATQRYTHLK